MGVGREGGLASEGAGEVDGELGVASFVGDGGSGALDELGGAVVKGELDDHPIEGGDGRGLERGEAGEPAAEVLARGAGAVGEALGAAAAGAGDLAVEGWGAG